MDTPNLSPSSLPPPNTPYMVETVPSPPPISRSASSQRPDHSAVDLPSPLVSTTPLMLPPASPGIQGRPEFSSPYGAFTDSQNYGDDKDPLMPSGTSTPLARRRRSISDAFVPRARSRLVVLLPLGGFIAALVLLSRMSIIPSPNTTVLAGHLTPFLPAGLVSFIGSTGVGPTSPHPILPLLTTANEKWSTLLASQSTTFDKASKTYKARYQLPTPPGFDKWFAFAIQGRNHTLVDEYDGLMADLLPYRSLSPTEIRRRTAELAQIPGISIVSIRNGAAQVHSKSGKWAPALAFQLMLGAFVRDLPDMDIAINEKPEGRVLPKRQRTVLMEDYGLEGQEEMAPSESSLLSSWGGLDGG